MSEARRWDEGKGFYVDACRRCGREGPIVKGEIEPCVQADNGALVLSICRACREATTVADALLLLRSGTYPTRVSLLDELAALSTRVEWLERRLRRAAEST